METSVGPLTVYAMLFRFKTEDLASTQARPTAVTFDTVSVSSSKGGHGYSSWVA